VKKGLVVGAAAALGAAWWFPSAPRPEIGCCVVGSIEIDRTTGQATAAVDRSADFAAGLRSFPSDLPAYDDAAFLEGDAKALVTAHDGQVWTLDPATLSAQPLADVPLMAWGIHEAPDRPDVAYFCAGGSYGARPPGEQPGLYRLNVETRARCAFPPRGTRTASPGSTRTAMPPRPS
jgi:hypothetical protein